MKKGRLRGKIKALQEQMQELKTLEAKVMSSPGQQLSMTDPDARPIRTRGSGIVGYNVQTAVDAEHHLIVAHEVVTEGSDRDQLAMMAEHAARPRVSKSSPSLPTEALQRRADPAVRTDRHHADRAEDADVEQPGRWALRQAGLIYVAADDEFQCPANERAIKRITTFEGDRAIAVY